MLCPSANYAFTLLSLTALGNNVGTLDIGSGSSLESNAVASSPNKNVADAVPGYIFSFRLALAIMVSEEEEIGAAHPHGKAPESTSRFVSHRSSWSTQEASRLV